jgi:hypothetical protein
MSTEHRHELPKRVREALNDYRKRYRTLSAAGGAFLTVAIAVGAVGVAIAADRLFKLDFGLRAVLLLTVIATTLYSLARWVLGPVIKRLSDRRAAVRLGRSYPDLEEDLVTAVELSADGGVDGVSDDLIDRALQQIEDRTGSVDARRALSVRPVLEAGGVFVLIFALLMGVYVTNPKAIAASFRRLFDPAAEYYYATLPVIEHPAEETVVSRGDELTVRVRTEGDVRPEAGLLRIEPGSGKTSEEPLEFQNDLAEHTLKVFEDEYLLRAMAGDGTSEVRKLRVVPPPNVAAKRATVIFPEYSHRRNELVPRIERPVRVFRDGAVNLEFVTTDRNVEGRPNDPRLRCDGTLVPVNVLGDLRGQVEPIPLKRSPNGLLVTEDLHFPATGSLELAVTLTDGYGNVRENVDSVRIDVVSDGLPTPAVLSPGNAVVLPDEEIYFRGSAEDDLGVHRLELRYRIIPSEKVGSDEVINVRMDVHTLAEGDEFDPSNELSGEWRTSAAGMALSPGQTLEYAVRASDWGRRGARLAETPIYRIECISREAHLQEILREFKDIERTLKGLADREGATANAAGDMAERAEEAERQGDEETAARVAEDAEAEARAQAGRMDDAMSLSERIRRLMPEIAKNPAAHDLLNPAQRLAEETENVARESMNDAREELEKAAGKEPQEQDGEQQPQDPDDESGDPEQQSDEQQDGQQEQPQDGQQQQQNQQQQDGQQQQGGQQQQSGQQQSQQSQSQSQSLQEAQESAEEAEERLEQLAREAQRLQNESLLDRLATEAERLAARQIEIRQNTIPLAERTIGRNVEELPRRVRQAVTLLAASEQSVADDIATLATDIEEAIITLSHTSVEDSEVAQEALDKMEADAPGEVAEELAALLRQNNLLKTMADQQRVADTLQEVAAILRDSDDTELERAAKQIKEFIRRQKAINATISTAIERDADEPDPMVIAGTQSVLKTEVRELALALGWLARELGIAEIRTPKKLNLAAGEMTSGVGALYDNDLDQGLAHGERALKWLLEADEDFSEEQQQMQQQQQQQQEQEIPEALILLMRILVEQKKLNRDMALADQTRPDSQEKFFNRLLDLVERESALHVDIGRLKQMLQQNPDAVVILNQAAGGMDVARLALDNLDTTRDTRVVGSQVVTLLESFLRSQQGGGGGGGGGANMQSLMQQLTPPGQSGGGYEGGSSLGEDPGTLDEGDDSSWTRLREEFEREFGAGSDQAVPDEFRGAWEAYKNHMIEKRRNAQN